VRRHEGIPGVFPLHDRRELKALRQHHGNVLERVDREVGAPFRERGLELLDEETLAAHLGQ